MLPDCNSISASSLQLINDLFKNISDKNYERSTTYSFFTEYVPSKKRAANELKK